MAKNARRLQLQKAWHADWRSVMVSVRLASVQTIIFDYDDTLVRTREIRYGTLQRLVRDTFAAEISAQEIDAAWGIPGDQFLLKILGRFLGNDLPAMWRLYNQFCAEDPNALHNGVAEFFDEFSGRFSFGILTSSSGKRVHAMQSGEISYTSAC